MVDDKVMEFIFEKEELISPHIMTEEHFNETKDYSFLQNVVHYGIVYDLIDFFC